MLPVLPMLPVVQPMQQPVGQPAARSATQPVSSSLEPKKEPKARTRKREQGASESKVLHFIVSTYGLSMEQSWRFQCDELPYAV